MQHSNNPQKETLAVSCYLDESGMDKNNQTAVLAGLLLNKWGFIHFDFYWRDLLVRFNIEPPLHMREFGRHGKLGKFNYEERNKIFTKIVEIINKYKIVSIAAVLRRKQFEACIHQEIRKRFSFYGFCFLLCVEINHRQAENNNYQDNIAFLLDDGNRYKGNILRVWDRIKKFPKTKRLHVGSLTFDDDENISALQAADVIAWGVRRFENDNLSLNKGFEPIKEILANNHLQIEYKDEWLREFSDSIMSEFK